MSFNTALSDFEPLTIWLAGAGPVAAYALAMALVTKHSAALLPSTTRVRSIAAAVFCGFSAGWIAQQTALFGAMLDFFQAMMILGVLIAITGVGALILIGFPLLTLFLAYKFSKRDGQHDSSWFFLTLSSWAVVGWWIQMCISLVVAPPTTW